MKSIIAKTLIVTATLVLGLNAYSQVTNMHVVESTTHAIASLAKKNSIDKSFVSDSMTVVIEKTATGYVTQVLAPSADAKQFNTISMTFDLTGKLTGSKSNFVSVNAASPIFTKLTAAKLLDLGAEAIVDHLADNAEIPVVSENAKSMQMTKLPVGQKVEITLNDGRVYTINMDAAGVVVSKGF